jgi:hypothetical protein
MRRLKLMGFAPLLFVISDCTDVSGSVLESISDRIINGPAFVGG